MQVEQLIPILMPGISLQLFVQAYYIWDCVRNPNLNQVQKIKYAISIALFTLPAAAYYLIKEQNHRDAIEMSVDVFPSHIRQAVFVLIVSAFEILSIQTIVTSPALMDIGPMVWISAIIITLMIIIELSIQKNSWIIAYFLSAIMIFLGFALILIVKDFPSAFLTIILSVSIINNFPLKRTRYVITVVISGFIAIGIIRLWMIEGVRDINEIFGMVYLDSIIAILVIISFFMLKRQYSVNHQLSKTLQIVENQYKIIEELSKTEERNKIAREIHDTVGHRLTGALYILQAQISMESEIERKEKLKSAHEQIKGALADIRHSVRLLVSEADFVFDDRIQSLINDMKKNTALDIEAILEVSKSVPFIHQRLILRSLMECITNTLKHSTASKADILIQESGQKLLFSYTDNGSVKHDFRFGFGLTTMRESVQSLGGFFTANSSDDGFMVSFTLPLGRIASDDDEN